MTDIEMGWIMLEVSAAAWVFYVLSRLYDRYHRHLRHAWNGATYRLLRPMRWAGVSRYRNTYPPHQGSGAPWRDNRRA